MKNYATDLNDTSSNNFVFALHTEYYYRRSKFSSDICSPLKTLKMHGSMACLSITVCIISIKVLLSDAYFIFVQSLYRFATALLSKIIRLIGNKYLPKKWEIIRICKKLQMCGGFRDRCVA